MTRILLTRHGQSTWNEEGRWQGQEDPPLSELGERQAAHAASVLGLVDGIFSSTLERASATAEIIAESLGIGPVVQDADLVERCAGEWQGLTRDEIELGFPGWLEAEKRPPGWEDDDSLVGRGLAALARITAAHPDGDVLVVTHGGLIYAIEAIFGEPHQRIANLGGRWLYAYDGTMMPGDRVDLLEGSERTTPDTP